MLQSNLSECLCTSGSLKQKGEPVQFVERERERERENSDVIISEEMGVNSLFLIWQRLCELVANNEMVIYLVTDLNRIGSQGRSFFSRSVFKLEIINRL